MYTESPVIESIVKLKRNIHSYRPVMNCVHIKEGVAYWADGYMAIAERVEGEDAHYPLVDGLPKQEYVDKFRDQIIDIMRKEHATDAVTMSQLGESLYQQARRARTEGNKSMVIEADADHKALINPVYIFDITRKLRKQNIILTIPPTFKRNWDVARPIVLSWSGEVSSGRAKIMTMSY